MRRPLRLRDGRKASSVSGPLGRSDCFEQAYSRRDGLGCSRKERKDRLQEASRQQTVTTTNQEDVRTISKCEVVNGRPRRGFAADFRGMTPVSNGVEQKTAPSDSWSPGARCTIGAPSARISLVRLRPRRAGLRFSGHLQSTTYWHDPTHETPRNRVCRRYPTKKSPAALDATGSFRGRICAGGRPQGRSLPRPASNGNFN